MKINEYFAPLLNDHKRFEFLIGGAGSGKSRFCAGKILLRMMNPDISEGKIKPERFLICRKVDRTCAGSVYQLFKDIIDEEELTPRFRIGVSNLRITFENGSTLTCAGIDDPEKVKSITGITSIWMEEATEFEYEDFLQLNLRLRGDTPSYKQIMLSTNPISELSWIKKFVEDPVNKEDLTLHSSTFLHNALIDDTYKKELLTRYSTNELWYMVYVKGQWGKILTGGEFYKNFKREIHVGNVEYDPELPLHLSFDENVKPYFPCAICQIKGKELRVIDEIAARDPNNRTTWMDKEIEKRYYNHTSGMFIYGDATSQKDDVKQEKGMDLFRQIMNGLAGFRPQRRVANSNPNVRNRGDWINDIFAGNPTAGGIKIIINERCTNIIDDYYFTKEDAEGGKDKRTITDKDTKEKYQPYGHFSDALDYLLCFAFAEQYGLWQTGGTTSKIMFTVKKRSW